MRHYSVNPLLWIRRHPTEDGSEFVVCVEQESGFERLKITHPAVLKALGAATGTATRQELTATVATGEVDESAADRLIETLVEQELLVPAETSARIPEEATTWFDRNWRHALYYHLETRDVPYVESSADTAEEKEALLASYLDEEPPALFTHREGDVVELPEAEALPERSLEDVLLSRRTSRNLSGTLDSRTLATVLDQIASPMREVREYVAERIDDEPELLTLSSYLAYEIYPVVLDAPDIEEGIYHYRLDQHALSRVSDVSGADIQTTAAGQPWLASAPLLFFFTVRFDRYQWRYRHSRAFRNLLIESGALGQRAVLAATALGLDSFMTPALLDSKAESMLEIDGINEGVVYLIALGE